MDARAALAAKFTGWLAMGFDAARCPVRSLLDRVGDRWSPSSRPQPHEVRRSPGSSRSMLQ